MRTKDEDERDKVEIWRGSKNIENVDKHVWKRGEAKKDGDNS